MEILHTAKIIEIDISKISSLTLQALEPFKEYTDKSSLGEDLYNIEEASSALHGKKEVNQTQILELARLGKRAGAAFVRFVNP